MRKTRIAGAALSTAMLAGVLTFSSQATATTFALEQCTATNDAPLTILSFTDYHGRITSADTFFGTINQMRETAGADNTLVVSAGDNVGASIFESSSQQDNPTIDILNAAKIDVSSVGNHELDKGYTDFTTHIKTRAEYPYVSANLTDKNTGKLLADGAYQIFDKAGVKVAVVGGVTSLLPSLISPDTFQDVELTDPVDSINAVAKQLKSSGQADVVVAAIHEGSPFNVPAAGSLADATAASGDFDKIVNGLSSDVDAIVDGHTHVDVAAKDANGRPVVQAAKYAEKIGQITLQLGTNADGKKVVCNSDQTTVKTVAPNKDVDVAKYAADITPIQAKALADAKVVGEKVIANTTAPITRGLMDDGKSLDNRQTESTMSDLVAQMFHDQAIAYYTQQGKADGRIVVGVQNPGGTRADFSDAGDITYAEAAAILPFANTVMTTDITGNQFRTMLEQQWQPNGPDGEAPSRAVLALGLSGNVTYTFDETKPVGQRISNVFIDGQPMSDSDVITVVSGSFLIAGGDNFTVLKDGKNPTDTGITDLDAWVNWLTAAKTVSPDFARQGVSLQGDLMLTAGKATTWSVGMPFPKFTDSLDIASTGAPANTQLTAKIDDTVIGTAEVKDGQAKIDLLVPSQSLAESGEFIVTLVAEPSKTSIPVLVDITSDSFVPNKNTWLTGETLTLTGDRFKPGDSVTVFVLDENGNRVQELGTVTADDQGMVTWIGRLPAAKGDHYTIVAQGTDGRTVHMDYQPGLGEVTDKKPAASDKKPAASDNKPAKKPTSLPKTGAEGVGLLPAAAAISFILGATAVATRRKH